MPYEPDTNLEAFKARRQMTTMLGNREGANLMGELQEAPLDDPALRQEVFDDRLSQSGTTYGEHSSSSLVRGGPNKHTVKTPVTEYTPPNWAELRRSEIQRSVMKQENDLNNITDSNEKVLATSRLDALKSDQVRINDTLNDRAKAKENFMKMGGTWADAKKNAGKDHASMKEARWQRQEFMDKALWTTAKTFLEKAAKDMGCDPQKISELQRSETPFNDSKYLDGRERRFQLEITGEAAKIYGSTLTVTFDAPGSTEDTSDIDMQFIVEENPAACSELIKTFQDTATTQLKELGLGDKSLAQRFDMNPYPAGFVFRAELGSDLHFSDTYTKDSLNQKKTVDSGLALLRRLDSSPNPKAEIEKLVQGMQGPERKAMLRSIGIGAEVSLKAQLNRANALHPKMKNVGALQNETEDLSKAISNAGPQGKPDLWTDDQSEPSIDDLVKKIEASRQVAGTLNKIAGTQAGGPLVAEARNDVYVQSLKEVEKLTMERDKAVVSLGAKVLETEKLLEKNPDDPTLKKNHQEALGEMRATTSKLGVESFLAQGVALHHADEAYTTRGAIGHVVEQQIGRKFVATTSSAISSIESNQGFILEHIEHDHPGEDLASIKGTELDKFAASIGKYIERIGQAMETVDYRSVVPNQGDVKEGKLAPHQQIAQLGRDLALIKKNLNPETKEALTDPGKQKPALLSKAMEKAGITNMQELKDKLEAAVLSSWKTQIASTIGTDAPAQANRLDAKTLESDLAKAKQSLKSVTTDDRSAPVLPKHESTREALRKPPKVPVSDKIRELSKVYEGQAKPGEVKKVEPTKHTVGELTKIWEKHAEQNKAPAHGTPKVGSSTHH